LYTWLVEHPCPGRIRCCYSIDSLVREQAQVHRSYKHLNITFPTCRSRSQLQLVSNEVVLRQGSLVFYKIFYGKLFGQLRDRRRKDQCYALNIIRSLDEMKIL